jgi:hypothetical protein
MNQDYEYINKTYGLNVEKGSKLKFIGFRATVVGSTGSRLIIQYDATGKRTGPIHPTWEIEYEEEL